MFRAYLKILKNGCCRGVSTATELIEKTISQKDTFSQFLKKVRYYKDRAARSVLIVDMPIDRGDNLKSLVRAFGDVDITYYTYCGTKKQALLEFNSQEAAQHLLKETTIRQEGRHMCNTRLVFCHSFKDLSGARKPEIHRLRKDTIPVEDILYSSTDVADAIKRMSDQLSMTELQHLLSYFISQMIEDCMTSVLPYASVTPFGSTLSGLGCADSDLDMILHMNGLDVYSQHTQRSGDSELQKQSKIILTKNYEAFELGFIRSLSFTLRYLVPGFTECCAIPARVPIVKLKSVVNDGLCDISITPDKSDGLLAAHILYSCAEMDERVRPLVLMIKHWAKVNNLTNDNPGKYITNFALNHLVVAYLQASKVLPSNLQQAISGGDQTTPSAPPEHAAESAGARRQRKQSLGTLYRGFFKHYSLFDFKENIININGTTGRKRGSLTNFTTPLKIENTQNSDLNIAKAVSQEYLDMFVLKCSQAASMLMKDMSVNTLRELHRPPSS